jgi:nitrate reductase molybdenum cofactor assembly chaperone NarJ/NarW
MRTFKILGMLLSYPKQDMVDHLDQMAEVLKSEALLQKRPLKKVLKFIDYLKTGDIYEHQEEYVELFDRGRAHCLHMFEHIHGESRDRGQAMVNLIESYAERGFYMAEGELPDFLPLFLEYLSQCPAEEAVDLIGDPINVVATIGVRLKKRDSHYYLLFEAMQALAKVKPDAAVIAEAEAEKVEVQTLDELDVEWEEAEAFDNSVDCNSSGDMANYHAKNTHPIQPSEGVNQ